MPMTGLLRFGGRRISMLIDNITLVPSYLCNLNCYYCHQHAIQGHFKNGAEISKELIDKTIEFIATQTRGDISFYGGEPLLFYEEFMRPISQAFPDRRQNIITNGILCRGDLLKEVSSTMGMRLSYDGFIEGSSNYKNSQAAKNRVEEILEQYETSPHEVAFMTVITKESLPFLPQIMQEFPQVSRVILLNLAEEFSLDEMKQIEESLQFLSNDSIMQLALIPFGSRSQGCVALYGNGDILLGTMGGLPPQLLEQLVIGRNFQVDPIKFEKATPLSHKLFGIKQAGLCRQCILKDECLQEKESYEEYKDFASHRKFHGICATTFLASKELARRGISFELIRKANEGRLNNANS